MKPLGPTLLAAVTLALAPCFLQADTRGLKAVAVKDRVGNEISLYKGSYALLVGISHYTAGWPDLQHVPLGVRGGEGHPRSARV
jgi:hypothetical protein